MEIDPIYILIAVLSVLVVSLLALVILSVRRTRELLRMMDQAQEKLRRAHEQLKSVDKLKTEFMNIAAHELKTPLVPMVGYLHLIDKSKLDKKDQEGIDIALRNTQRLQRLVNDILDIAKLESKVMKFDMGPVPMSQVVGDAIASAKPFADKKKIYIKSKVPKTLPVLYGDAGRLTQVVTNLLNNAIKFTDKGGITVVVTKEGTKVHAQVKDTGIGMKRNEIGKLFTKFYQADSSSKRKYGGTGLGLAICKEIVKFHKGKIWVTSRFGHGSIFHFTIPIKKVPASKANA